MKRFPGDHGRSNSGARVCATSACRGRCNAAAHGTIRLHRGSSYGRTSPPRQALSELIEEGSGITIRTPVLDLERQVAGAAAPLCGKSSGTDPVRSQALSAASSRILPRRVSTTNPSGFPPGAPRFGPKCLSETVGATDGRLSSKGPAQCRSTSQSPAASKAPGTMILIPRLGVIASRSSSPVTIQSLSESRAKARMRLSFGSLQPQISDRTDTGIVNWKRRRMNSWRSRSETYRSNFSRDSTSASPLTDASETTTSNWACALSTARAGTEPASSRLARAVSSVLALIRLRN